MGTLTFALGLGVLYTPPRWGSYCGNHWLGSGAIRDQKMIEGLDVKVKQRMAHFLPRSTRGATFTSDLTTSGLDGSTEAIHPDYRPVSRRAKPSSISFRSSPSSSSKLLPLRS